VAELTSQNSFIKRVLLYSDIGLAIMVMMIVAMMIIPVPTWFLDILLATNITLGVVVLLSTFYVQRALELASFPTMLLLVTLFRLALNVSTTRLILLRADAGKVISAFGNFVVGGNYVVGGVVFLILVIIQFVVITKGSERVAEVAARFTLDAMPGKQMAIDADLNAGLIDEDTARNRRREIQREADFYGAMDGASKFVKGDAIAGLIITLINIIGGLSIGVLQRGMTLGQAGSVYSLLTVGDGLVSQIPALLFSTATGVIVTRAAGEGNLGRDIFASLMSYPRPLFIGAVLLFALAFVPGLPTVPFLILGIFLALMGYWVYREGEIQQTEAQTAPSRSSKEVKGGQSSGPSAQGAPVAPAPASPEDVMRLLTVDPMEIEIGYAIIPLVDPSQGGDMLDRIGTIRKQMALEFGLVVPPIRIRDNIQLKPSEYIIRVRGAETGRGELLPDHYLAMNTGNVEEDIVGVPTVEPAFGLQATWISPELRDKAESMGYTVVDAPSVLATHLSETIKRYGSELLTRQEVQKLTDLVKESSPAVIEEMLGVLSLGEVQKVLQNLVKEQIPIRDLVSIFESLADHGRVTRSVDYLTERVREALSRIISLKIQGDDGFITVATLSPQWEQKIKESLQGDLIQGWQLNMDPESIQELMSAASKMAEKMAMGGHLPVFLTHPEVRLIVRRLLEGTLPGVYVVSYNEISQGVQLKSAGMVE